MTIYSVVYSKEMRRGMKRVARRGKDMRKLTDTLDLLSTGEPMPPQYLDHALVGNWKGYRECHVEPDWLLIYEILDDELVLIATRTGTHSDIY